ncbi:MAG: DUF4249 family protein [Bacteroidetes bacterium]|nr:DUF4249 family protein [Bacteroidota bacterium]
MMRTIPFLTVCASLFLVACERPYDINLADGMPQYTIDAFVNNSDSEQTIRITRSIPFNNDPSTIPGVEGAQVAIFDSTDFKVYFFSDRGKGTYTFTPNRSTGDTFRVGHDYILAVIIGADTFISGSTMHPTAPVDSLSLVKEKERLGVKAGQYVELGAKDLPGKGDCYWIKTFINGAMRNKVTELNLAYDGAFSPNAGSDGIPFIVPIRYLALNDFQKPYKSGDRIRVEIHSITPETLYFFTEVRQQLQNAGLFATIPANVKSNVFNLNPKSTVKANGFFCMSAVSSGSIVIP